MDFRCSSPDLRLHRRSQRHFSVPRRDECKEAFECMYAARLHCDALCTSASGGSIRSPRRSKGGHRRKNSSFTESRTSAASAELTGLTSSSSSHRGPAIAGLGPACRKVAARKADWTGSKPRGSPGCAVEHNRCAKNAPENVAETPPWVP